MKTDENVSRGCVLIVVFRRLIVSVLPCRPRNTSNDGVPNSGRQSVAKLHGHGAVGGIRALAKGAGTVQRHRTPGDSGRDAASGRTDHVQENDGQGPAPRLRVPNARTVAQHLHVAQARLVDRVQRHANRGHRRQFDRHMDSSRSVVCLVTDVFTWLTGFLISISALQDQKIKKKKTFFHKQPC